LRTPDPTAGDGRQQLRDGGSSFEGRARVHAIAGDIGVEDRTNAVLGEFSGERQNVPTARLTPTVGSYDPIARIHGHDQGVAHLVYCPQPQLAIQDRRRAHYDAGGSGLPQGSQIFELTHTATNLQWHTY
jgi:hypothetical protein